MHVLAMSEGPPSEDLVEAAEPNPLLYRVDGLCAARDWEGLLELARRCREATERGKQLWPIAEHIAYRLALEAPGEFAGPVLTPDAGRFALGPLTEVAASTHSFDDLEPFIVTDQIRGVVAAERVIRGEDLTDHPRSHPEVLELPMRLLDWEPSYCLAHYRSSKVLIDEPAQSPRLTAIDAPAGAVIDDADLERALIDLVHNWIENSNARATAVVTEGGPEAAIAALCERLEVMDPRGVRIDLAQAMALMAWAAASSGGHARRRGAAAGRSTAWWAASVAADVDFPSDPAELGEEAQRLHWMRWTPSGGVSGWSIHLAIGDPDGEWGAALAAQDLMETSGSASS